MIREVKIPRLPFIDMHVADMADMAEMTEVRTVFGDVAWDCAGRETLIL